ncbi:hypothetical protein APV28_5093 [Comamonas testosteroni]|nr:hypothetical protein APV28_5093 [Comamonas testosteroni]
MQILQQGRRCYRAPAGWLQFFYGRKAAAPAASTGTRLHPNAD